MDYNTQYKIKKIKWKDTHTNVFGIHVRPLRGANIDAQYILDPYVATSCCTSYLTKINRFVTQEMKIILTCVNMNKEKHLNALKS